MAERIEKFTPTTERGLYPWHEWADGSIWRVDPEKEIGRLPDAFQRALYNRATYVRMRVRTHRRDGIVEFQFLPRESAP